MIQTTKESRARVQQHARKGKKKLHPIQGLLLSHMTGGSHEKSRYAVRKLVLRLKTGESCEQSHARLEHN